MTALSKLVPLVVLFVVLAFATFIGYAAYTIATDIADKTSKKMEKKNVSFGKEGMKIGIKEVKTENYVDQTQRYRACHMWSGDLPSSCADGIDVRSLLVKAWNYSSWPEYKSRFWNKENEQPQKPQSRTA